MPVQDAQCIAAKCCAFGGAPSQIVNLAKSCRITSRPQDDLRGLTGKLAREGWRSFSPTGARSAGHQRPLIGEQIHPIRGR